MNSIIQVFNASEVRFVVDPRGSLEFGIVAADLAAILEHSDTSMMAKSVEDEWKGTSEVCTPGGTQSMSVIWEPGVYELLAKSRKPLAKPFKKWLFTEVLPSIRKTGSCSIAPQPQPEAIALPPRNTIDYVDASATLEATPDTALISRLRDAMMYELSLRLFP